MSTRYPLFVRRDLDGFFGLFVDNLVQLLLIISLCTGLCGMSGEDARYLYQHILPGAAVSIVFGNLFYAWQAHRLAARTGRDDVTALPYGINTVSLLVFVFFVIKPVYDDTQSAEAAWQMGLLACLGSGLIEFSGSLVADTVRRNTPRAALLSTLAGIAIGFISMTFALEIFQYPLVAMLPLAVILITYFSRISLPWGLPGGLIAVTLGTLIAWVLPADISGVTVGLHETTQAWEARGWCPPQFAGAEIWKLLTADSHWLRYLSVIVPMGLFNVIGSLQNIESAEAAGDSYDTRSSLAVNGVGTMLAAGFGSCFPTTIYIGHPGWNGLGARAGYSTLNGVVIALMCLTGTVALVNSLIPMQAGIAIVLWIGIIITAQAFQSTPREHAPAVAVGLFPAIAAWGATVVLGALTLAGGSAQKALEANPAVAVNGFLLHGMFVMERGYIFTCMMLAAISVFLIEQRFYTAAIWSLFAAAFAYCGLTHAYQISGNALDYLFAATQPVAGALAFRANQIAVGYLLFAAVFFIIGVLQKPQETVE
ncbi:hypothetical protein Pan258_47740 [Symmachiella dynata]|uniref:NCS2 family permease n=1 Tax=Symmachiella dynata TaxID=2527995 RepID=UPI00118A6934|nr:NCS2 family permease [Symmachiella dynata]QDT50694.1 hypothetical protein Pan258_47740 [Symmachiella dynata]